MTRRGLTALAKSALPCAAVTVWSLLAVAGGAHAAEDPLPDVDEPKPNFQQRYERLHASAEPRPVRAALEMLGMLGIGTTWYWIAKDQNAVDWDDPALKARFTGDAWRLDNNGLRTNFLFHPLAGSAYYGVARANDLGVGTSAAYSFMTSFAWEYGIEFREKVSINDVFVTPAGGIVLGEFFHKLAWYLNSPAGTPSTAQDIVRWSPLGLSVATHRAWNGGATHEEAAPLATSEADNLGYSNDIWHGFELGYRVGDLSAEVTRLEPERTLIGQPGDGATSGSSGLGAAASPASTEHNALHGFSLRGRLVSIPGYRRPGTFDLFLYRADITSLSIDADLSSTGEGIDLLGDTLLLGYHTQAIDRTARGPVGQSLDVGTSMGLRYLSSDVSGIDELLGIWHMPGAALDWYARDGELEVEIGGRAHLDFGGVGALAFDDWEATYPHPRFRGKAILRKQGHYYAWGGTFRLNSSLRFGPLSARGRVSYSAYDSQEGLDRAQERLTVDPDATDTLLEYSGTLDFAPAGNVYLGVGTSTRHWRSSVGEFRAQADVRRYWMQVGTRF